MPVTNSKSQIQTASKKLHKTQPYDGEESNMLLLTVKLTASLLIFIRVCFGTDLGITK